MQAAGRQTWSWAACTHKINKHTERFFNERERRNTAPSPGPVACVLTGRSKWEGTLGNQSTLSVTRVPETWQPQMSKQGESHACYILRALNCDWQREGTRPREESSMEFKCLSYLSTEAARRADMVRLWQGVSRGVVSNDPASHLKGHMVAVFISIQVPLLASLV